MKKWLILCLVFVLQIQAVEVLVLKNGKLIKVESFQLKGEFVVFENDQGKTLSLPKSAIDFERSKAATEAYQAKLTADGRAYQAKLAEIAKANKRRQKSMSMGEIAKQIEDDREGETPQEVTLNSNEVQEYGENNPYDVPQSNSTSFQPTEDGIVNRRQAAANELPGAYREAKATLDRLLAKQESITLQIERLENSMAFNETIGSGEIYYELIEAKREELKMLQPEIEEARQALSKIDRRARETGISNYKNMKPQPSENDKQ